ncbi:MAG: hypothetical protein U0353_06850 [Sandaracinus sp.]
MEHLAARTRRPITLVVLLVLALLSVWSGRLDLALALASLKALVVGLVLMELDHAHRVHLAVFTAWVVVVAFGAWLLAT